MKIAFVGSNQESRTVRRLVERAVSQAGHELVGLDSDKSLDQKTAFDRFRVHLAEVSLVIADVSDTSSQTSLELGAALQAGKPIISMARSGTDAPPSVLQSGPYLTFQGSDKVADIQSRLIEWIDRLADAAPVTPGAPVQGVVPREHKLFISYSHQDKEYLQRLLVHLRPLERAGKIELWSDTQLRAGDRWKTEIQTALERATIAVLLVSADFMASQFIVDNELPPLLKSAEERGTKILPLIVKPCRFVRDPDLSQFQAANDPSRPFILLSEGEKEALLDQVAAEVERFVGAA